MKLRVNAIGIMVSFLLSIPSVQVSAQTVAVDAAGKNTGAAATGPLANAVVFGAPIPVIMLNALHGGPMNAKGPSATGIGSNQEVNGANFAGLDFYTASLFGAPTLHMSLTRGGLLGLGTPTPASRLEIDAPGRSDLSMKSDAGFWAVESSGKTDQLPGAFQIVDAGAKKSRLHIDSSGTVSVGVLEITGGSDVAEPFGMNPDVAPGSVMVIDDRRAGELKLGSEAYDRKVAGVVSGAGGIQPGLRLRQIHAASGQNVALSGRVYALADASSSPIHPGDLLTTSSRSGHCMKAVDRARADGAILGKAMSTLERGQGLILVLVSLE